MALHEILARASKTPKKENPTKRPKVPPSSATWELMYSMMNTWSCPAHAHDKTDQRGEGIDELLHLVPGDVWQLELDGQGLPCLVGDRPHGEQKMVGFPCRCLLLIGKAVLPVQLFLKRLALPRAFYALVRHFISSGHFWRFSFGPTLMSQYSLQNAK